MINYEEFEKAVDFFELIGIESKSDIKKKYLKLSKKYHPDTEDGSDEKFQELNKAYRILTTYIDNFKFRFTRDEFKNQNPISYSSDKDWF